MEVKLQPEPVPSPLWQVSCYNRLPKSQWQKIRKAILQDVHDTCCYCGAVWDHGQVCHEEWDFDDATGVVTLTGFAIACRLCNFALHPFRAAMRDVDRAEEAITQLMAVNGITRDAALALVQEASHVWQERSNRSWRVAVAPAVTVRFPVVTPDLLRAA